MERKVEYDIFPCPPDYILVEVPKDDADERALENSPLYTGVGLPK